MESGRAWYLIAWCRLRGGIRAFRFDRISDVVVTREVPDPRPLTAADIKIDYGTLQPLSL